MKRVNVGDVRVAPRWGRFTVQGEDQIDFAMATLKDAHARIKAAMKAGESTCYITAHK